MTYEEKLRFDLISLVLQSGVSVCSAVIEANRLLGWIQGSTHPQQVDTGGIA